MNKRISVLHIAGWYHSKISPKTAPFIKRHIDALGLKAKNKVWHVEVKKGKIKLRKGKNPDNSQYIQLSFPFVYWYLYEVLYLILVLFILIRERKKSFDIINLHIAYPLAQSINLIKKINPLPIVITEHWSAYHFGFNAKRPLPRIQNIFKQNVPVIVVSKALANDIRQFSGADFPYFIIPNVVDSKVFYPDSHSKRGNFFFMVGHWQWPKNPFVVLEAFKSFLSRHQRYKLIIGGYGNQYGEIRKWVVANHISEKVILPGYLDSNQIAKYLRTCKAFLHPSKYETFSVVCAEALACETLVVANNTGGIPEVIGNQGILLQNDTPKQWLNAMEKGIKTKIPISYNNRFSPEKVGQQYLAVLEQIIREFKK